MPNLNNPILFGVILGFFTKSLDLSYRFSVILSLRQQSKQICCNVSRIIESAVKGGWPAIGCSLQF